MKFILLLNVKMPKMLKCQQMLAFLWHTQNIFCYVQLLKQITRRAYSKTCVNSHTKKDKANILMTNGSLMQVKCIAECSKGSILQYFWPA